MVRILIIWPPKIEYVFSIQKHFTYLGETAEYLRSNLDADIKVMDGSALNYFQWDFISAFSLEYDYLLIYTDLHNGISALDWAKKCKSISPKTIVISYGQGTPYAPDIFLKGDFDVAIIDSMFEKSILKFILFKNNKLHESELKGIYYKNNGNVLKINETCEHDITKMSFPALDLLPVNQYKKISGRDQICFTVARGCSFPCRFCRAPIADGKKISYRLIPDIINYIPKIKDLCKSIKLIAPTFTANRKWVVDLCEQIISNKIKFNWIVTTRLELLDEELLELLSSAGCIAIAFGLESFYESTQEQVDKNYTPDFIISQIKLFHKYKIIPKAFIMLGIPGQTKKEIDDMYNFLSTNKIEIRPKEYYPYELFFSEKDKFDLLKYFERDDVYKNEIKGITKIDFVRLLLNRTNVR